MANDPVPVRRYNEREVALILKRAAERENELPQAREMGYSLAELEEIAAQAGISPASIRAVARDLDHSVAPLSQAAGFLGAPTVFEMERIIEGELPESEYADVVETIRRATHEIGTVTRVERALEWGFGQRDLAGVHVTITPARGRTKIRVVSRHDGGAFLLMLTSIALGTLMSAVVVFGGFGLLGLPAAGGMVSGVGLTYLGDRKILSRVAHRRSNEAAALLDVLAEQITRVAQPVPQALPESKPS